MAGKVEADKQDLGLLDNSNSSSRLKMWCREDERRREESTEKRNRQEKDPRTLKVNTRERTRALFGTVSGQ